ncbi:MAG: hypothetical protein KDJ48_12350 [Nitratireductor sp.]|nr:hypothetical protein [Nitratireductor sp.]
MAYITHQYDENSPTRPFYEYRLKPFPILVGGLVLTSVTLALLVPELMHGTVDFTSLLLFSIGPGLVAMATWLMANDIPLLRMDNTGIKPVHARTGILWQDLALGAEGRNHFLMDGKTGKPIFSMHAHGAKERARLVSMLEVVNLYRPDLVRGLVEAFVNDQGKSEEQLHLEANWEGLVHDGGYKFEYPEMPAHLAPFARKILVKFGR